MHKSIYTFTICLSLILGGLFTAKSADAFFIKLDIEQSVSRITGWIQTMKEKCQEVIEGVQSSQFGQFVGKGIEDAKKGLSFAKEGIEKSKEITGNVLSSDAAKATQIATQIAQKTSELDKLKEEKSAKEAEVNAEMELLKEQTSAKINLVQANLNTIETKGDEIDDEEKLSIEAEIENINYAFATSESLLKDELKSIEDDYKIREEELTNEIKELTSKSAELAKSFWDKEKENKAKKNTEEAINETYKEYTTQKSIVSIKEKEAIKRKRQKGVNEKISSVLAESANKRGEIYQAKDNVDNIERLSGTMPSEAGGSVVIGNVLSEQIDALRKLIEFSIVTLETQTTMEIGLWQKVTISKMPNKFNLCDYALEDMVGYKSYGDFDLDKIKQKSKQVKDKIEQAVNLSEDTATTIMDTVKTGLDNQSTTSLRSMF